jgi:glucose-1-phosphatase
MAIRAVIFDIGGVLVRTEDWSGRAKWEARLGLPPRSLTNQVFDSEAALQAERGEAPDAAIWQSVAAQYALSPDDAAQLRADFWSGDRLNVELLAFARGLRPRWRTAILSNAWPEMRDLNVSRFGLGGVVDEAVYSFDIGVLKPDPGAYQAVLRRLNVQASEAVFVDDSAANIAGARAVGLQVVHFTDTHKAVDELSGLLW